MLYLINKNIVFNTEDRTLAMLQDDMSVVVLSNSSNRLLYELLYDYGQTVSRDTLFQNVWDKHGLVSSNSNLNHYISQLRKSLTSFGLSDKVIVTVPKVGFRFSDAIPVVLISEEGDSPRAKEDEPVSYSVDRELDKLTSEILAKAADATSSEDEAPEPLPMPMAKATTHSAKGASGIKYVAFISIFLAVLALVLGVYYFGRVESKGSDAAFSFKRECHIYTFSHQPVSPDGLKNKLEKMVKNKAILCADGQFIMVHSSEDPFASLCSVTDDRVFQCKPIGL